MTVKMASSVTTVAEGYRNFIRLAAGHKYQVELVSTQAKDTSGNLLYYTGNEAVFTFTTADVSTTQNIVVPVQSPSSVPGINISIPKGIGIVIPMDLWTEVSIQVVDQSTSEVVFSDKVVSKGSRLSYSFDKDLTPGTTYQLIEDYKGKAIPDTFFDLPAYEYKASR